MTEELLFEAPLLAHLSNDDRCLVAGAGTKLRLDRGEILFHEGDRADAVFVLTGGRMKLVRYSESGRELLIHLVAPGQSFAEAALFGSETYPATAEALEDSTCWRLPRQRLVDLVRERPELGLSMMASIAMWTRRLVGKLQLLTQRRVEERLALYLLSSYGRAPQSGDRISLGSSKQLVAAQCGTAPEVLSRTFRKLEDAGVLKVDGDAVTVLDAGKLHDLAEWIDDGL